VQIDLNHFKLVNDTLGHEAGDQLLIDFALCMLRASRQDVDYIYRTGGDEFVILCTNSSQDHAEKLMLRVANSFSQHTEIASIAYGILQLQPYDLLDLSQVLLATDTLMYQHKKNLKRGCREIDNFKNNKKI
jgi:diguanylate cyclase (GGDEF)-like protein